MQQTEEPFGKMLFDGLKLDKHVYVAIGCAFVTRQRSENVQAFYVEPPAERSRNSPEFFYSHEVDLSKSRQLKLTEYSDVPTLKMRMPASWCQGSRRTSR